MTHYKNQSSGAVNAVARGKSARLEYILRVATEDGFAHVDELAETLGVSRMTIHRDLDDLQLRGLLRKVRGGASTAPSTQYEADLEYRRKARLPEKRVIAAAAINLIDEGNVVLLDDSTSALELVPLLDRFEQLTLITNFQDVIDQVRHSDHVSLISLGGQYSRHYASFLGVMCEEAVGKLAADIVFISTSALCGTTLYHQDQSELLVKRAMLRAANRRVLLMDSSKVGQRALYQLCDVAEFTHVVVDSGVSDADIQTLRELDLEVIVAATGQAG